MGAASDPPLILCSHPTVTRRVLGQPDPRTDPSSRAARTYSAPLRRVYLCNVIKCKICFLRPALQSLQTLHLATFLHGRLAQLASSRPRAVLP